MSAGTVAAVLAVGIRPGTGRLRAALRANAGFCLLCGMLLAVAGGFVAERWELGPAAGPPAVGVGLVGFGVWVARLAVLPARRLRRWAVLVVAADLAWVAGSVVLLVVHPRPVVTVLVVTAVGVAVIGLAAWQVAGMVAARGDDPLADVEVLQATRIVTAAPEAAWQVVSDHRLYGRLAPNLASVEAIGGPEQPLRRRCVDRAGRGWEETCTLWDEGRRFAVAVDPAGYPYPLASVHGLWQVDPVPAGSRISMRFVYQAEQSIRGGLFTIMLRLLSPYLIRRILRGWQNRLSNPITTQPPPVR